MSLCLCSHVFSRTVAAVDTKRGYIIIMWVCATGARHSKSLERPCSRHRGLAEADVCDGVYVYQLVFLSPEVLSNETWRDRVPSSVCSSCGWSLMNFTSVACHVTLGSNVTKLHSALERNPCTSSQTRIFPSLPPPPFPTHAHEEKYGWLARLYILLRDW